ncbi:MAG: hypothetical protein ACTSWJ_08690 [Candidatus Heimdallarchaeaceae archaeon]
MTLELEDPQLKILLGNSIPLPEEDQDDNNVASESGQPDAEEALKDYYFSSLTGNIGKEDFQFEFASVIDFVARYPLKDRMHLCYSILKRIKEVHDFVFPTDVDINDEVDIQNVLDLIKFIEYDNEKLIVGVWKYVMPKTSRVNFILYCEQNRDKILSEIEEQIDTYDYNELITEFVKSYEADKMIKWFCTQSERFETAIKIELIKEQ